MPARAFLRAYRSDWKHFLTWCNGRTASFLPAAPETVALYLVALAETYRPPPQSSHHPARRRRRNPAGVRRTLGTAQLGKIPLLTADLVQVLAHLPSSLAGMRDRALLLLSYTGGLRRSELAALTVDDLAWVPEGAVLTLRRSKTDQTGQGRKVAIPRGAHAAIITRGGTNDFHGRRSGAGAASRVDLEPSLT